MKLLAKQPQRREKRERTQFEKNAARRPDEKVNRGPGAADRDLSCCATLCQYCLHKHMSPRDVQEGENVRFCARAVELCGVRFQWFYVFALLTVLANIA